MLEALLCKPLFFDVTERDLYGNDHMDPLVRPDRWLAYRQHEKFAAFLIALGVKVPYITPSTDLEDMTFTANGALVVEKESGKKEVILSNFTPPRRQEETAHYEHFFRDRGYKVHRLPDELKFEGAGDARVYKDKKGKKRILCGYDIRTSFGALQKIAEITGMEVTPLQLVRPETGRKTLYHFDTTTIVLEDIETFITYPGALAKWSFNKLKNLGKVIAAPYEDAENLALNAVVIPRREIKIGDFSGLIDDDRIRLALANLNRPGVRGAVIISATLSDWLKRTLERLGYAVFPIELGEFLKSGGGPFCLINFI